MPSATSTPSSPSPSATATVAAVTSFSLSAGDQSKLTALYASYRRFPLSDIAGISLSQTAQVTASGVRWALERFDAATSAPTSVQLEFQDGADIGLFMQAAGSTWQLVKIGSPGDMACDSAVPAAVPVFWGYGPCVAASTP